MKTPALTGLAPAPVNCPFVACRTKFSNVWLGIPSTLAVAAQD
ncbi:hypothetical protein C8R30_13914 [Nitrosomonas nitrosa]|jgi:hypothetical protein|nr:hypothetical protein C8R30_13914 [Nitrosomonas nitrosa]